MKSFIIACHSVLATISLLLTAQGKKNRLDKTAKAKRHLLGTLARFSLMESNKFTLKNMNQLLFSLYHLLHTHLRMSPSVSFS